MRMVALLVCAVVVWAATPLNGTWKLNRKKSSLNGVLPSFIHNDTMSFPARAIVTPAVPPSNFIALDGNDEKNMYRVDVSSDQRTLTVTRIQSYDDQSGRGFHTLLVLEKQ